MLGIQKRVDRVGNARDRTANQGHSGFVTIGQDIRDRVGLADPKTAKEVGGLGHAPMKSIPCQRFGLIFWPGKQLKRDRVQIAEFVFGVTQQLIQRRRRLAGRPWLFLLNGFDILDRGKLHHMPSSPIGGFDRQLCVMGRPKSATACAEPDCDASVTLRKAVIRRRDLR